MGEDKFNPFSELFTWGGRGPVAQTTDYLFGKAQDTLNAGKLANQIITSGNPPTVGMQAVDIGNVGSNAGIPDFLLPPPQQDLSALMKPQEIKTSSWNKQIVKGRAPDEKYLQNAEQITGAIGEAQQQAADKEAEAESRIAKLRAKQAESAARRQVEYQDKIAATEMKVAQKEAMRDQALADLRETGIDPDQLFRGREGRRLGAALAVALGGFAQGISGGRVPNTALHIIDRAIERNIAAQRADLEKKKNEITGHENALAFLFKKLGSMDMAERSLRDGQLAVTQMKVDGIRAKGKSASVRARAFELSQKLELKREEMAHQERVAAMPRETVNYSGSKRIVPANPAALRAALGSEATGKKPPDKILKQLAATNTIRRELVDFYKATKGLKLHGLIGGSFRKAVEALRHKQARLGETLAKLYVPSGASTEMINRMKDMLGGKLSTEADVKKFVGDLVHEVGVHEEEQFRTYGRYYNLLPHMRDSARNRYRAKMNVGVGSGRLLGVPITTFLFSANATQKAK